MHYYSKKAVVATVDLYLNIIWDCRSRGVGLDSPTMYVSSLRSVQSRQWLSILLMTDSKPASKCVMMAK